MIHLAVEAVGIKYGGGATVLADLLSAAVCDPRFSRISVFCSPRSTRRFNLPASAKITEIECPLAERSRLYRWWRLEHRLAGDVAKIGAHVVLCMTGAGLAGAGAPSVTFIQQSLPFSAEVQEQMNLVQKIRVKAILRAMKRSCQASKAVLVQTHTMKTVVGNALGIPSRKIQVATPDVRDPEGLANSARDKIPQADGLDEMRSAKPGFRLLYVGNAARYKNVQLLLDASAILRKQFPDLSVFLTWPRNHPLHGREGIVCLGYLDGPRLAEAYRVGDVFVMPSLQETVGLPMMEAMSAGMPVAAADRPYAREMCGNAAVYFNPLDANSLASQLKALVEDDSLRCALRERGLALSARRREDRPYAKMLDAAVAATTSTRELSHA